MGCEAKVIVILCTVCSTLAVAISLSVIPAFYMEINQIYTEVLEGVQSFRVETDSAWTLLMDVQQQSQTPAFNGAIVSDRANPFDSIFRKKRQQPNFSQLPAWCQCEPPKPICPPGPPGTAGQPGTPGIPGLPGPPGEDNLTKYPPIECPRADTACIKCPGGPRGVNGAPGPVGPTGTPGQPGLRGKNGAAGRPGQRGPPGDAGETGAPGKQGSQGKPGTDAQSSTPKPGPKGKPGPVGEVGRPGNNGQIGQPGAQGPRGSSGQPGPVGLPGPRGQSGKPGNPGIPGSDAAYCPCPSRSSAYVNRNSHLEGNSYRLI